MWERRRPPSRISPWQAIGPASDVAERWSGGSKMGRFETKSKIHGGLSEPTDIHRFFWFFWSPQREGRNTWIEESYPSISRLEISKIRFRYIQVLNLKSATHVWVDTTFWSNLSPRPNDQARNQAGSHHVAATEEVLGKHGGCHPWWQVGCGGSGLQGSWRTNQGRECQEGRVSMRKCLLRSKLWSLNFWNCCEPLWVLWVVGCFKMLEDVLSLKTFEESSGN